jgi:hypothetical protein
MGNEPILYDKNKWDTTCGLDYSKPLEFWPKPYKHHDFDPLFKRTKLISQYDMEGRGDGFQINKKGDYLFINHFWSSGISIVNVKDPKNPKTVWFESTGNPHMWTLKNRIAGDIMVTSTEWKFFENKRYFVNPGVFNYHGSVSKTPVQSGLKFYDISNPEKPRLLSFYETGIWVPEGGCNGCHRFWFDGRYVYASAEVPGFDGNIMLIIDASNPEKPREVSRFWLKGQWTAGGERPAWPKDIAHRCQHHHPIINGDRAYTTWFGLGAAIVDISDIRVPTLISHVNYDMGGQTHTFLPIRDRQYAVLIGEYRHAWMLDIRDERYPKVIAMFPKPPGELLDRGVGNAFGPGQHNMHENMPGPDSWRSDEIVFMTAGAGGLRIYDIKDPYRIEEIGYYVPGTPNVYYDPRGPEHASNGAGVDVADVWVDQNGLCYLTSYNGGLEIVEFEG